MKLIPGQRFAICLDLAHAHLSKTPVVQWQRTCEPFVAHYHINDNRGKVDEHLPLGEGSAPWGEILSKVKEDATLLLEVNSLESYHKCAAYLDRVWNKPT
ncbi:MAG: sugar phosphate isomerase/epimerase family protein [Acutalibacter sp.]